MKSPTRIERQHVYLRYRELFSGKNALVRTKKDILGAIQASSTSKPSAIRCHKRKTIFILRTLLERQIFELEEQARKEFPELWVKIPEGNEKLPGSEPSHLIKLEDFENNILPQARLQITTLKDQISFPLNADPPRFSYEYQHHVLAMIQQMLEESCFNFTQKRLPAMLVENVWTCAAAVELTKWLDVMVKRLETVPEDCIDISGRAMLRTVRPLLAHLRHSAVHRLSLEPGKVLEMVDAALTLAKILRDNSCTSKLEALHTCLTETISRTKCDTEAMQQEVNRAYLAIRKQREALRREEQQLRESTVERISGISAAADLSLLDCAYVLQGAKREESVSKQAAQLDKRSAGSEWEFLVAEEDIESDEEQLKADLC